MINDNLLKCAISRIQNRSEKQKDIDKLINTFVDSGIIGQLNNTNNQIFFGRRGTGKTHVLRFFEQQLKKKH